MTTAVAGKRLTRVITAASSGDRRPARPGAERWWLAAALALTLLFGLRRLMPAWVADAVDVDAFQHAFWLARLRDPELFRGDLIAEFYESLAPPGYRALYWALSPVVQPVVASKVLPLVLGLATAAFAFLAVRRLHPAPGAAFLSAILLSWYFWQRDGFVSATPHGFLVPCLTAQIWALVTGRSALTVAIVSGSTLLYPVAGALGVAVLAVRLVELRGWRPTITRERSRWVTAVVAAVLVGAAVVHGQISNARFGPTVTAEQARAMPEFGPHGFNSFFTDDAGRYWLRGARSGLSMRQTDVVFPRVPLLLGYGVLAALLPLTLVLGRRLPSVQSLSGQSVILLHVLLAMLGLFFLAHLLLFHLYVPSRYLSVAVPLSIAAGLAIGMLIEAAAERFRPARRNLVSSGLPLIIGLAVAAYPVRGELGTLRPDPRPALTAYLRSLPKDVVIVGATRDTDHLPYFANRGVLASRVFAAFPYRLGYYWEVKRRLEAVIDAYYAETTGEVLAFASRYDVDVMLVNRRGFRREGVGDVWGWEWEPYASRVNRRLSSAERFALLEEARHCAAFDDGQVAAVPVECLRQSALSHRQ